MDNKYYVPQLEEFFIGYEHQVNFTNSTGWETQTMNLRFPLYQKLSSIQEKLSEGLIRTKYLDSSDIESEGFTYKDELLISSNDIFYKELDNDEVCKIHVYWDYRLTERENLIRVYRGSKYNFPYTEIFRGDIKNISELKKLLKQLNIKK